MEKLTNLATAKQMPIATSFNDTELANKREEVNQKMDALIGVLKKRFCPRLIPDYPIDQITMDDFYDACLRGLGVIFNNTPRPDNQPVVEINCQLNLHIGKFKREQTSYLSNSFNTACARVRKNHVDQFKDMDPLTRIYTTLSETQEGNHIFSMNCELRLSEDKTDVLDSNNDIVLKAEYLKLVSAVFVKLVRERSTLKILNRP